MSQAFRSTSAVKWYEIKSCRWLDWSLFKTVLACLSAAGRPAACLASGSDTLVPCSRMTPLSKVCLIYFAHCLSRVPPCTQTLWSVHSLLYYVTKKNKQNAQKKRQLPFVCIPTPTHSDQLTYLKISCLRRPVGCVLHCLCGPYVTGRFLYMEEYWIWFGKFLGLEKYWKYSCSQTFPAG